MTNTLSIVAKLFSSTLIFLLQNIKKKKYIYIYINVFAMFQGRNFNVA